MVCRLLRKTRFNIKIMKKILITGGAGFVGRHLAKALLKNNYQITILDNLYRWNLKDIAKADLDIKKIKFIEGDICDEELVKKTIYKNDIIIHLASISQVMTSLKDPDKCFEYNVIGAKNVIKYCAKYNKKLIFSSSREVYGTAKYLPVDLNHPLLPENPYGVSKIIGESLIKAYAKSFGLKYVIFRLSNIFGSGDKERVAPIFIEKANAGQEIIIFGKDKIIDFVYIDDVVQAFLIAIETDYALNKTLNIGSGVSTSLKKLAKLVIKITDSKSQIKQKKARLGEVDRFTADIRETKKILKGWLPKVDIETGLEIMLKNYRNNLKK